MWSSPIWEGDFGEKVNKCLNQVYAPTRNSLFGGISWDCRSYGWPNVVVPGAFLCRVWKESTLTATTRRFGVLRLKAQCNAAVGRSTRWVLPSLIGAHDTKAPGARTICHFRKAQTWCHNWHLGFTAFVWRPYKISRTFVFRNTTRLN